MNEIRIPTPVMDLYRAHRAMCEHFKSSGLSFTLDGKLVGDIGEVLAADAFGIALCRKRTAGVDGHTPDGRSVQIKATGKQSAGPAFTPGEGRADSLLFLRINFGAGNAEVIYNGPEAPIRDLLPLSWSGTKVVPLNQMIQANLLVAEDNRLRRMR